MDDALGVRRREPARDLRPPYSIALRAGSGPPAEPRAQVSPCSSSETT